MQVAINISVSGLGNGAEKKNTFVDSQTPECTCSSEYQVQETADTAEALNIGALDDVIGIWIRAIENDIAIDTSYDTSFHTELIVYEGQCQFFVPAGTVYIKNNTSAEKVIFEYLAVGLQD